MKSSEEDIKDMLTSYFSESDLDSSFEGLNGFTLSVGKEPDEPIEMISIFETSGGRPQLTFDRSERYEYPSVQIRVRAYNYQEGWRMSSEIKEMLHGRAQETWNDSYYSVIYCLNGPFLLDYDKNQRPRFIVNFNLQRR